MLGKDDCGGSFIRKDRSFTTFSKMSSFSELSHESMKSVEKEKNVSVLNVFDGIQEEMNIKTTVINTKKK